MFEDNSSWLMRASTVGLAILNPLRCRIGRTAPSRAGFKNLSECQLVGQRTSFSLAVADDAGDDQMRLVEGRAISVEQEYPSSPPSWIEPGVSGVT
jgi:hypothetical protein